MRNSSCAIVCLARNCSILICSSVKSRVSIENAYDPDREDFGCIEERTRISANVRRLRYQRISVKARVFRCVRNNHSVFEEQRMAAGSSLERG